MKKPGEHNLAKKGFCVAFCTLACIMVTMLNGCFDSDVDIVLNSNGSGAISSKTRFVMLDKTTTNWFAQLSLVRGRYEGVTVQAQLIEETNRKAGGQDVFDRMAGVSQTVSFASLSDLGSFAKSHPAAASFSLMAVTDGVWRLTVPAVPYLGASGSNTFVGSARYLIEEGRSETGIVTFIDHAYPFSLMRAVCSQAVSRLRVTLPGDILDSNGVTDSVRTCSWDDQLGKMTCEELNSFFRNDRWVTFQWSNALAHVGSEAAPREILLPRPPGQRIKETTATIKAALDGASVRFIRPVTTNGTMQVSWTIACDVPADITVLNMLRGNAFGEFMILPE
jgi:hypothetical protein